MKNKYLVTIMVPEIEMEFEVYIPNNKKVGTIKQSILKCILELSGGVYNRTNENVRMFDRTTGIDYVNDSLVKDSGIRNGSRIIIM